jgi:hypothetical protein
MTRLVRTGLRGKDRSQPCYLQIFENRSEALIEYLLLKKYKPPGIIEGINSPSTPGVQLIERDQYFYKIISLYPFIYIIPCR